MTQLFFKNLRFILLSCFVYSVFIPQTWACEESVIFESGEKLCEGEAFNRAFQEGNTSALNSLLEQGYVPSEADYQSIFSSNTLEGFRDHRLLKIKKSMVFLANQQTIHGESPLLINKDPQGNVRQFPQVKLANPFQKAQASYRLVFQNEENYQNYLRNPSKLIEDEFEIAFLEGDIETLKKLLDDAFVPTPGFWKGVFAKLSPASLDALHWGISLSVAYIANRKNGERFLSDPVSGKYYTAKSKTPFAEEKPIWRFAFNSHKAYENARKNPDLFFASKKDLFENPSGKKHHYPQGGAESAAALWNSFSGIWKHWGEKDPTHVSKAPSSH